MSARDEGGAYARIRESLSELGLDAMAAGLPHWMSAVVPPARLSDDDSARRRYSFHALPIA